MARQVIETTEDKVKNGKILNYDDMCIEIGEKYNKPSMTHIEKLYFVSDGSYYHNCFLYNGVDLKLKGKKYVRIPNKRVKAGDGKTVMIQTPESKYEVVKEILIDDIIKDYVKLIKNKIKN